jgi:hypothetical protein
LGLQLKTGGKFHPKLNIGERPIANKYREGKMKRTLKRELKVREIVKREAIETRNGWRANQPHSVVSVASGEPSKAVCVALRAASRGALCTLASQHRFRSSEKPGGKVTLSSDDEL